MDRHGTAGTGETLAQRLKSGASLSINEVSRLALRLLDVLQAIHEAGIIHRDVKPANVQLCPDDRIVLTDFGIASIAGEDPLGTLAGSPSYVSPEQLRGDKPEPTADLFSLGATLFAAVEGRPPFGDGDLHVTLAATMLGDQAPMLRAGPLRPVIAGLLAREPHDRPSPAAAREMLLECISGRRHRPDEMADGVGCEWRDDTSDRALPWSELTGPVPAVEDDRRPGVAIRRRSLPAIVARRGPKSAVLAHRILSTRRSGQWLQVSRRLPG